MKHLQMHSKRHLCCFTDSKDGKYDPDDYMCDLLWISIQMNLISWTSVSSEIGHSHTKLLHLTGMLVSCEQNHGFSYFNGC